MRTRCFNPRHIAFDRYGGRGITICDRWLGKNGFQNFLADMGLAPGPKHSIDRIDNDGPYSPENCRWVTPKEQAENRRDNNKLSLGERTKTLAAWAREFEIPERTLSNRLARGWSVERTLLTAIHNHD
jgi:hypothetical protein